MTVELPLEFFTRIHCVIPDELPLYDCRAFPKPDCGGGPLKPAVVFHGGSLHPSTRDDATRLSEEGSDSVIRPFLFSSLEKKIVSIKM